MHQAKMLNNSPPGPTTDRVDVARDISIHIFAALAEFEQDIIRERTEAGLVAARARRRKGGRPKGLPKKAQHTAIIAEQFYPERKLTVKEICDQLSISKGTFYNYLRRRGVGASLMRIE